MIFFLGNRDAVNFISDFQTDCLVDKYCVSLGPSAQWTEKIRKMGDDCLPQKDPMHKSQERFAEYFIPIQDKDILIFQNQKQAPKGIKVNVTN